MEHDSIAVKSPWVFFLCLQMRPLMIQRQAEAGLGFAIREECVRSCTLAPLSLAKADVCLPPLPAQRHLHIFSLQFLLFTL